MAEAAAAVPAAAPAPTTDAPAKPDAAKVAAKPEAPPAPKKLPAPVKIKHKGKEVEIDDLDRLTHLASKGFGSSEVFEEARKLKADADARAEREAKLKAGSFEDRLSYLTETFGDEEQALAFMEEALYAKRVKPAQLTPEQREIEELRAYKKAQEDKAAADAKKAKETELDKQAEAIAEQYAKTASEAMEKLGWPADLAPLAIRRLQPYAEQALELGLEPMSEEIVGLYMEDEKNVFRQIAGKMEGEALLSWLGEDVANRIRKHDIARLKSGFQAKPAVPEPKPGNLSLVPTPEEARGKREKARNFWDIPPHTGG